MIFYLLMMVYLQNSGMYTVMQVAVLTDINAAQCDRLAADMMHDVEHTYYWCEERVIL